LPCEIRVCGRYFGNKGALTTHMMLKHPGQRPTGQTTIQLKGSGSRKFPVPFWKFCAAFVLAGICWKSDMDRLCKFFSSHVVPPLQKNVTKIVSPEMCRQKSRAPKFPILEISRPWKRERNKGLKQLKHEQGFVP